MDDEKTLNDDKRSSILSTWLWLLFWIVVPNLIAGLMTNQSTLQAAPFLDAPGEILRVLCFLAYGVILLRLGTVNRGYMISGICALIGGIINAVVEIIGLKMALPEWGIIFTLASAVIGIVGECYEYTAHADVVEPHNFQIATRWRALRKWYVIIYVSVFASIVLTLFIPFLGAIVMMAASMGVIIISIEKLVYLYKTAKIFHHK